MQIGSAWEWYHCIGLDKDINRYRLWIFNFSFKYLKKTSKFWAVSHKNESNLLLVRNMVCISASRNLISFADFVVFLNDVFLFGLQNTVSKSWSKLCGQGTVVIWIADCWYSSNILFTSHNPKNNCWHSQNFGARFGGEDRGLCLYNPFAERHLCKKRLRTLKSFQILKTEIKNWKTYNGWWFLRPIQWYHSHADLIWPDNTLKKYIFFLLARVLIGFSAEIARLAVW
jgi:hypothetical protein